MKEEKANGTLFCMSGTEKIVAQLIHYKMPDIRISPAMCERYRQRKDKRVKETGIFMPGYVFFESENNILIPQDFPHDRGFRLLKDEEGDWRLRARDKNFVKWLFSYDAELPISTAYTEGTVVQIVSGPLKELHGWVRQIDVPLQQALVEIHFRQQKFRTWLGFDALSSQIHYEDGTGMVTLKEPETFHESKMAVQFDGTQTDTKNPIYTGLNIPGGDKKQGKV